jgi:GDSL-like lipase/acylhydrolase family protein
MTRSLALLAAMLLATATALAQGGDVCAVPEELVSSASPLPRVADAIGQAKHLQIAVVGSASSTLRGASGVQHAYPAQLEAELVARLPGVAVKVVPHIQQGAAADVAATFPRLLAAEKPNLVVWQTGTSDVMLGIDPDSFQDALDKGVQALQTSGTDVILMNLQYSPRTDPMMHVGPYAHAMQVVAEDRGVPLFDRTGIMKYWNDEGVFDFYAMSNDGTVERVHHCIGRLLADVVIGSSKAVAAKPPQ